MADEIDDADWLLRPPDANEVHLRFSAPQGAQLSEEARRALETLLDELQGEDAEVSGFRNDCGDFFNHCKPYSCTLRKCQPLVAKPCFIDTVCRIAQLG